MVDASVQMPKLSMGSNGNHHRTLNAGSNPHSALRTKENNCQQGVTAGYLNDQLKGNKRNTFYANSSSSNQLHKINSKTHALTNRNLSFHSTNSTRLGTQPTLGNN